MKMRETVLFVDDEEQILDSLRWGLIDEEYRCLFAQSGYQALAIMEQEPVSVIVTDMKMPGIDGLTLLNELKAKYPNTVRLVLSGYTQLQQILATINQADIFKYITKPWKLEDELKKILNQAVDYHRMITERENLEHSLKAQNAVYQNMLRKIEGIISASKSNNEMIAVLGRKALDIAFTELEMMGDSKTRRKIRNAMLMFNSMSEIGPEGFEERDIDSLCKGIQERVMKIVRVTKFNIENHSDLSKTLFIKYKHILLLVESIISTITSISSSNTVRISVQTPSFSENGFLEVLLLICATNACEVERQKGELKKDIDLSLKTVNQMATEAARFFNGVVQSKRVNDVVVFRIGIKVS